MDAPIPRGSIVVGIDGSEPGERALRWATEQARLEHRPLVLVHAISPQVNLMVGEPGFDSQLVLRALRREGEELLEDTSASIGRDGDEDLVVHRVVRVEDPRQVLLDVSRDASMIVVGSRGRGPVRALLLGSVSVAVSQHAQCPVVVLRPQESETEHGHVVVGVNSDHPTSNTLEFAYRQASLRSLSLTMVHGFWDPLLGLTGVAPTAWDREAAFAQEAGLVAGIASDMRAEFPDVAVIYQLAEGVPADCLVRASHDAAMVVVGTQHKHGVLSLLGDAVSRAVLERAHCVVAVIPEK